MDSELEALIAQIPIDPKTHPVILQEFEYTEFKEMQRNKKRLHLHKWTYRSERKQGDFLIIHNVSPEWPGGLEETSLPNGRYCRKCRRVEFYPKGITEDEAWKSYDGWTQLDMIALGIK